MDAARSKFSIFFAWQSDIDQERTTDAIRAALRVAANRLEQEAPISVVLDEATREVPGAPYIPFEIARKIKSADVFVGDVTSIYRFPGDGKSLPNPNVTFEAGVAAAHLGWHRIVLLFSKSTAAFASLPFDFDRHRMSPYALDEQAKRLEGRVEPLSALLVEALRLIIAQRPKRPFELDGKTPDQIRYSRDEQNIRWFMSQFSAPLIAVHARDAPEMLHYFAPYFHDSMKSVIERPDFRLYDRRAFDLISELTSQLGRSLAYDHFYSELSNRHVQAFGRRDRFKDVGQEQEAAADIRAACDAIRRSLDELIEYVCNEYLAIDTDATSAEAAKAYYASIRDLSE